MDKEDFGDLNNKKLQKLVDKFTKNFSSWISQISFIPLFLSMCGVKLLDMSLAYITYLYKPYLFIARESNIFLYNAVVNGKLFPFFIVEGLMYLLFGIIAFGLVKLKQYPKKLLHRTLGIQLTAIGILVLWLYPITMATNIVNGLLALDFVWPFTNLMYLIPAIPIAWMVTRYGWNFKNRYAFPIMLFIMVLISLQL